MKEWMKKVQEEGADLEELKKEGPADGCKDLLDYDCYVKTGEESAMKAIWWQIGYIVV